MAQAHARVRGQASAREYEVDPAAVTPGTALKLAFASDRSVACLLFRIGMAAPAARRATFSSVGLYVHDLICLARQPEALYKQAFLSVVRELARKPK